jgi:uncharacterized lipoprotein NlpE involved in copper resistance
MKKIIIIGLIIALMSLVSCNNASNTSQDAHYVKQVEITNKF